MPRLSAFPVTFFCLLLAAGRVPGEWPQFRGPNGSGIGAAAAYPVEFSPSKNLVWKHALPFGQSSPVVVGRRVFVTAVEGDQLMTICFDARTGRELWRRPLRRERTHQIFRANDPASPTPAADDNGVVVFFPDAGLIAYTPEGKERWTYRLGPFRNFYGQAASPILAEGLVVLVCDQQAGSFVVALDRATGRERWKTDRAGMTVGWATPMVFRPPQGPAELIVLGTTRLDGYYLSTGELRWWLPVASMGALGTPVAQGDTLMVSTLAATEPWMPSFESVLQKYDKDQDQRLSFEEFRNDPDLGEHFGWIDGNGDKFVDAKEWNAARAVGMGEYGAVAVRPGQMQGQLDASAILWRFRKNLPYIPAPLLYQNIYYTVRDGGIITALDAVTGNLLKEGRSREALGEYYASPVAGDGKVYLASGEGKVTVLKAGADWQVLAVNDLGDEIHATPALAAGLVYIRTHGFLYCFGAPR